MLDHSAALDRCFHALADANRRALLERLARGDASVSELAAPMPVTLAAIVQHIQVLEESGLVRTRKIGRVRTCSLERKGFATAERWLRERRSMWEGHFDRLGDLLLEEAKQTRKGKQKMSHKHLHHGSFTIERTYPASIERVFDAFAKPESKARWFSGPPDKWRVLERSFDFRVGGSEVVRGRFEDTGAVSHFAARYHVIVPNDRIVYAYDMYVNEMQLSVSLSTIALRLADGGSPMQHTHMQYTEQGVFFDGPSGLASREQGTATLLDRVGESLRA